MYLGLTYCTVREFHGGYAFRFPPTSSAVRALQIALDVHTSARCNGLNVPDLAENLGFIHYTHVPIWVRLALCLCSSMGDAPSSTPSKAA